MTDTVQDKADRLAEIDQRVAILRHDILDLTNRAAAVSGQAAEDAIAQQIEDCETELAALQKRREEIEPSGA